MKTVNYILQITNKNLKSKVNEVNIHNFSLFTFHFSLILSENTPIFKPGMRAESSEKENTVGFSPWKFIATGGSK